MSDPDAAALAVDPAIAAEHPGLRAWSVRVAVRPARTPPELRERLALIANRIRGAEALALRTRPVPWAYRVLFRQLGLDPDVTRTPIEELVLERLLRGGAVSHGLPADALALATLETGVPVLALDADAVAGELALAVDPGGRIVLADASGPVVPLFAPPSSPHAPGRDTRALLLVAIQAPGVEDMFVLEALWTAAEALPTIDAPS